MCNHPNREAAMAVIEPGVWCDPCLAPLVKALNDGGIRTAASCCGHGRHPGNVALADGRFLTVADAFAVEFGTVLATLASQPDGEGGR